MHVHLSIKSATKVLALIAIMVSMSACQNNPQQQAAMPPPAKPAISPGTINLTVQILEFGMVGQVELPQSPQFSFVLN